MADNTAVYTGTGRRKEAVARVRLVPGTGKVTVNGRDAADYFGRQQLVDNALAPFRVTDTVDHFDVRANCQGGGITGQAGALRLGIARALLEAGRLASVRSSPSAKLVRSLFAKRPSTCSAGVFLPPRPAPTPSRRRRLTE